MRLTLYSFLLLIYSSVLCVAEVSQKEKDHGQVYGWGMLLCYDFLHPSNGQDFLGRDYAIFSWIQGYISGKNVYSSYDANVESISKDEQIVIIKTYCEEHGRDRIAIAAEYLYEELYKKFKQEK
jgi:hypothetical protein